MAPHLRLTLLALMLTLTAPIGAALHAQEPDSALSEAEIEHLRDDAYFPATRVLTFMQFLDDRLKALDKLTAGKRKPGREDDIHDLMEQFTSIANDLDDNLDDYSRRHRDIRKSLPNLISATERWSTELKTPPDHPTYNVSRKLALEAVADLHEFATKMVEEQKAWFQAHPPPKDDPNRPQSR